MNLPENSSPASLCAPQGDKPHRLIKLGVDVHLREYVVSRQIDGTGPQPAQRFSPEGFVAWAAKQAEQADVVHCCYEGPKKGARKRGPEKGQKKGHALPLTLRPEGCPPN